MPIRMLRDWTDSEPINTLDAESERLFTRLIMKADDHGRFVANPKLVRSLCFPLKDNVSESDVADQLVACESAGLISIYTVGGKQFLEINNFGQRLRNKTSKYPDRNGVFGGSDKKGDSKTDGSNSPQVETDSTSARTSVSTAEADRLTFLTAPSETTRAFWNAYPRKIRLGDLDSALQGAIATLVQERGWTDEQAMAWLLESCKAYAASPAGRVPVSGSDFRPGPAKWLSTRMFDDDRENWKRPNGDAPKNKQTRATVAPIKNDLGDDLMGLMR